MSTAIRPINQENLLSQINFNLNSKNPKTELRKFALIKEKLHHQKIMLNHYRKYFRLITAVCWKYVKKYKVDFDELLSHGNEIYVESLLSYDKLKAEFSTFLYQQLYYGLSIFCKKIIKIKDEVFIEENISVFYQFDKNILLEQLLKRTTTRTGEMIREILDNPQGFLFYNREDKKYSSKKEINKSIVQRFFLDKGWRVSEIRSSFAEVRSLLKEFDA